MRFVEVVVVGGSVAGLCCAITLRELGIDVLLVEGGTIGSPKVCGQFLSPECLEALSRWGVNPEEQIDLIRFRTSGTTTEFPLPLPAASMRRSVLEKRLAEIALTLGVEILEETMVRGIVPPKHGSNDYLLQCGKESIAARNLVVSTGRLPTVQKISNAPAFPYDGMNIYLPRNGESNLQMHSFSGGYYGLSPVDSETLNCALIAKKGVGLEGVLRDHSLPSIEKWHRTSLPEFGIRPIPSWRRAYFIGDAFAGLPPATGAGLALGVRSGILAAKSIECAGPEIFYRSMQSSCKAQVRWGCLLHFVLSRPLGMKTIGSLQKWFPKLGVHFFRKTRSFARLKRNK